MANSNNSFISFRESIGLSFCLWVICRVSSQLIMNANNGPSLSAATSYTQNYFSRKLIWEAPANSFRAYFSVWIFYNISVMVVAARHFFLALMVGLVVFIASLQSILIPIDPTQMRSGLCIPTETPWAAPYGKVRRLAGMERSAPARKLFNSLQTKCSTGFVVV